MKYPDDVKISQNIISKMKSPAYFISEQRDAYETVNIISSMDIVVGMRLHTLIFAVGNCVPCVGIIYDPKIRGFMNYIGQDRLVEADQFNAETLVGYVDDIMNNIESEKEVLDDNAARFKSLALQNSKIAVDILKEIK